MSFSMTEKKSPLLWMPGMDDTLSPQEERVMRQLRAEQRERKQWKFFPDVQERRSLFECFDALTHFLHDRQVADIVFLDRAARPAYVGVRECWKLDYPEEPRPGIFFLNSYGFKSSSNTTKDDLMVQKIASRERNQTHLLRESLRDDDTIVEDLRAQYPALLADKEKPIMVFDVCSHTGDGAKPVMQALREVGCKKLLFGTMNQPDRKSRMRADFYFFTSDDLGCYPFGDRFTVDKTYESVSAKRNTSRHDREYSIQMRQELRELVQEEHEVRIEHQARESGERF